MKNQITRKPYSSIKNPALKLLNLRQPTNILILNHLSLQRIALAVYILFLLFSKVILAQNSPNDKAIDSVLFSIDTLQISTIEKVKNS